MLESLKNLKKLYSFPNDGTKTVFILVSDGEVYSPELCKQEIKRLNFNTFCHVSFDQKTNALNANPYIYLEDSPESHSIVIRYINGLLKKQTRN